MTAVEIAEIAAVGFVAGVSSGMLGVGGGIIFVPGLVFVLGLSQLSAEATSLLQRLLGHRLPPDRAAASAGRGTRDAGP